MFRVADNKGMTVYQLENEMSHVELIEWGVYYEKIEPKRVTKQDMYLAQIAYVMGGSEKAKFKDFLLKFDEKDDNSNGIKLDGKQMAEAFKVAFGIKNKQTIKK